MGGCQNCDPFWGTLNVGRRIIIGIQKVTIPVTTTHILAPQSPYISIPYLGTWTLRGCGLEAYGFWRF